MEIQVAYRSGISVEAIPQRMLVIQPDDSLEEGGYFSGYAEPDQQVFGQEIWFRGLRAETLDRIEAEPDRAEKRILAVQNKLGQITLASTRYSHTFWLAPQRDIVAQESLLLTSRHVQQHGPTLEPVGA